MTKIAIIYYSCYNYISTMAATIKEGVESVDGVTAEVYQVAETLPEELLTAIHGAPKKDYPIATPEVLKRSSIRAAFYGLPVLVGKPAGIFFSTGTQGGGQETTTFTALTFLTHHGMTFVPLGYRAQELRNMEEIHGGSPWGAGTLAGSNGSRQPSKLELAMATTQGKSFAEITKKLAA